LRFYTPKALAKTLSAFGFVIENADSTYFVPYRLLKRRGKLLEKLNLQLEKIKGSTGWSLIVLCKKLRELVDYENRLWSIRTHDFRVRHNGKWKRG